MPSPNASNASFHCHDIGALEGPVLLCGGAYGNLEALEAFLDAALTRGVPPRRIIHTGDVVAYCADPAATAERLRASGMHAIKGNVEQSLGLRREDCGCGFEAGSACDALSEQWYAHADAHVGYELRHWMAELPDQITFTMAGRRARVVHGGVRAVSAFIFASLPAAIFEAELDAAEADIVVAGHCGIPFTRAIGRRVWHNAGSLGMPANDGTPRVWYSVLAPEGKGVRFEHVPLAYDHARAQAKMAAAGLPQGYAQALSTGLWPSLSVLPAMERACTGTPLAPEPVRSDQNGRAGPSEPANSVAPSTSSAREPPSAATR